VDVLTRPRARPASPGASSSLATPRVDPRSGRVRAAETRIRWLAVLLDDLIAVPGTGRRIGLKPLIGLIPVFGDLLAAIPGAWLILEAARFRLPTSVLIRMVLNLGVDLLVGIIPFVGDLFDLGFKSNVRNLDLFRRYATDPGTSTAEHRRFLGGLLLIVFGLVVFMVWALLTILGWLESITIAVR